MGIVTYTGDISPALVEPPGYPAFQALAGISYTLPDAECTLLLGSNTASWEAGDEHTATLTPQPYGPVVSVTAAYTIVAGDSFIKADPTSGGSFAVTLPSAQGYQPGQGIFTIFNPTGGANTVALDTVNSQTVAGNASGAYTLIGGQAVTLMSDGSNWQVYAGNTSSASIPSGTIITTAATKTAAYSAALTDWALLGSPNSSSSQGAVPITLPVASTTPGKTMVFKNTGGQYASIVQLPNNGATVDGSTSSPALPGGTSALLVADASGNWHDLLDHDLRRHAVPLWYDDFKRANTSAGGIGSALIGGAYTQSGTSFYTGAGSSTALISGGHLVSSSGVTYAGAQMTSTPETLVARFYATGASPAPGWAVAICNLTASNFAIPGINMIHLNFGLSQVNLTLWQGGTTSMTTDGSTGVLTGVSSTVTAAFLANNSQAITLATGTVTGTGITGTPTVTAATSTTLTINSNTTSAGTNTMTWSINSLTLTSQTPFAFASALSQSQEYEIRLTIPSGSNYAHVEVSNTSTGAVVLSTDFYDTRIQSACIGETAFCEPTPNSDFTAFYALPAQTNLVAHNTNFQGGLNGPIGMAYQSAGYFSRSIINMATNTPTGSDLDVFSAQTSGTSSPIATFTNTNGGGAFIKVNATASGAPSGLVIASAASNSVWKIYEAGGQNNLTITNTESGAGSFTFTEAGSLTVSNGGTTGVIEVTSSASGAGAQIRLLANGGTYASIQQTNSTNDLEFQTNGGTTRLTISSAGLFTFQDAANIAVGTTTGTKIGTATSQKLGFYNATPVVQPNTTGTTTGFTAVNTSTVVAAASTFTGNTGSTAYTIGDIVNALKTLGLVAS